MKKLVVMALLLIIMGIMSIKVLEISPLLGVMMPVAIFMGFVVEYLNRK